MELVDGYYGKSHITADQVADLNIGTFGADSYVLSVGNALAHEIITNNKVLIKDGAFVHQGRRGLIKAGTTETAIIANGAQNMKRNDFICIRYQKNSTTAVESFSLAVITGKSGTIAIDPVPITGDIRLGETISDFPIRRVRMNGLSIEGIDQLCSVISPLRKVVSQSGWSPLEEHDEFVWSTPQSVSAPNFEVKSTRDLSSYLSVGMKIRLRQNNYGGFKYFFIVKIDGDIITLYGTEDYPLIANSPMWDVGFSTVQAPHGFPENFIKVKSMMLTRASMVNGNQTVKLGFKPTFLKISACLAGVSGYESIGAFDGVTNKCIFRIGAYTYDPNNSYIVMLHSGEAVFQAKAVFTPTGFVLTWSALNTIQAGTVVMLVEVQ